MSTNQTKTALAAFIATLTPEQRIVLQAVFFAQIRIRMYLETNEAKWLEKCGPEMAGAAEATTPGTMTFGLIEFIEGVLGKKQDVTPEEVYSLILKEAVSSHPQ